MATQTQYVDSYSDPGGWGDWTTWNTSPWLSAGEIDYIYTSTKKAQMGDFYFGSFLNLTGTNLTACDLYINCQVASGSEVLDVDVYDGSSWNNTANITVTTTKQEVQLDLQRF